MTMTTEDAWPVIESAPWSLWPPYDSIRVSQHPGTAGHRAGLEDALIDIPLGSYDRKVLDQLATEETPTVAVLISLLHRAREAGHNADRATK
jgi:hypothetical protein